MSNSKAHIVALPQNGLIIGALPAVDYADAFAIELPQSAQGLSIHELKHKLFSSPPAWIVGLMKMRDRLAQWVGLKTSPADPAHQFEQVLVVLDQTQDELLMGQDDKHLDFRVSLKREHTRQGDRVVLSTIVKFHGPAGRCYFFVVKPFHKCIGRSLLNRAFGNSSSPTLH